MKMDLYLKGNLVLYEFNNFHFTNNNININFSRFPYIDYFKIRFFYVKGNFTNDNPKGNSINIMSFHNNTFDSNKKDSYKTVEKVMVRAEN